MITPAFDEFTVIMRGKIPENKKLPQKERRDFFSSVKLSIQNESTKSKKDTNGEFLKSLVKHASLIQTNSVVVAMTFRAQMERPDKFPEGFQRLVPVTRRYIPCGG